MLDKLPSLSFSFSKMQLLDHTCENAPLLCLAALYWLHVQTRFLFVFKSLNGLATSYLSDLLHLYSPSCSRSSGYQLLLAVPKMKLKLRDDQAFMVAAPNLWNGLPLHVREAHSLRAFTFTSKLNFGNNWNYSLSRKGIFILVLQVPQKIE